MSLYRHKTLFQPQAICAKKQTFSNSACLSLRAAESDLRHLRGQEEACLSLRAAESDLHHLRGQEEVCLSLRAVELPLPAKRSGEGWGEGCVLVTSRR
jgi:hypothetical protein